MLWGSGNIKILSMKVLHINFTANDTLQNSEMLKFQYNAYIAQWQL